MKTLTAYLKLFRIQNLLIIALLMYFVRYFLLKPVYEYDYIQLQTDGFSFFLFVLGYLLLTAGGYAINDYYDIGMDEINRPEKTILRKEIPLSNGQYAYFILTFIGVGISLWAILRINAPKLIFVLAIITLLFWFYSTKYKREFIVGNVAVAFLAALSVGIVWLYEFFASIYNGIIPIHNLGYITSIVLAYSGFAFLLTLIREIIKDMADAEGDNEFKCRSLPIILGNKKTMIIIYFLLIVMLAGIGASAWYFYTKSHIYMLSFAAVLTVMMIYFTSVLKKARDRKDYIFLSDLLKLIFLAGIISIQLYSIEIRF
jgi:4-hydroxybenzoate polyprenyltransferase